MRDGRGGGSLREEEERCQSGGNSSHTYKHIKTHKTLTFPQPEGNKLI